MHYLLLAIAIILELIATTLLKYSEGFTKLVPTIGCLFIYFLCFFSFSKALNNLNLGVAYALWSAVGIVITSIISAVLFGQKLTITGIIGIVFIIVGCVLLNLFGAVR